MLVVQQLTGKALKGVTALLAPCVSLMAATVAATAHRVFLVVLQALPAGQVVQVNLLWLYTVNLLWGTPDLEAHLLQALGMVDGVATCHRFGLLARCLVVAVVVAPQPQQQLRVYPLMVVMAVTEPL